MKFSGVRTFFTFLILTLQLVFIFVLITGNVHEYPLISLGKPATQEDTTPYLHVEEVVYVSKEKESSEETEDTDAGHAEEDTIALPVKTTLFEYVEVIDSCGPHFAGECLLVREGPGTDFPVVSRLRNGMVLKVSGKVERDDETWYKIVFDEWLRYPERVTSDWYVSADYVTVLLDEGVKTISKIGNSGVMSSDKKIVVDRSEQTLTAYDGAGTVLTVPISTGLALTPTPRGTFRVYKKTPSRYMQGPLPILNDKQYYDLPGVPWNLYFTKEGAVIHGAYWHESFGTPYSHGCVNLSPEHARTLYEWASLGTKVIVQE